MEGLVYGWGYAAAIGLHRDVRDIFSPELIKMPEVTAIISQVSCGDSHSAMLDQRSGIIYVSGINNQGQLGLGVTRDQMVYSPRPIQSTEHWTQVACGNYHTLALSKQMQVYGWGSNCTGELGLNHKRS